MHRAKTVASPTHTIGIFVSSGIGNNSLSRSGLYDMFRKTWPSHDALPEELSLNTPLIASIADGRVVGLTFAAT
jgi:hypothetical protein